MSLLKSVVENASVKSAMESPFGQSVVTSRVERSFLEDVARLALMVGGYVWLLGGVGFWGGVKGGVCVVLAELAVHYLQFRRSRGSA